MPGAAQLLDIPRGVFMLGDRQGQPHPHTPRLALPKGSSPTRLRVSSSRSPPHSAPLHFSCQA